MVGCFGLSLVCPLAFAAAGRVPDYVSPHRPKQPLAATSARVIVTDARPGPSKPRDANRGEDPLTQAELAPVLERRLKRGLGASGPSLVVHVKIVEGRELSESERVVRAVVDVRVEAGGRAVSSTRGVSTLHGSIGGMAPRTEERIQAAVIDAFERSVLRAPFIDATNAAIARGAPEAPPTAVAETHDEWTIREHESHGAAHVVSAVFDGGATYSFGARYLHDHLSSGGGLFWAGYGLEARFVSEDSKRLDALGGLAVLRAGAGVEHAFSVELGLGPAGQGAVRPLGIAGAYLSLYYVDLGFTYQYVIAPTRELAPLAGPHFGIRIHLPLAVHGLGVTCHSPAPCRPELIPGITPRDAEASR